MSAWLYDADGKDSEIPFDDISLSSLGEDRLLWVDVESADQSVIGELENRFQLDGSGVLSRLLDEDRRLFLDNYGDYLALTVLLPPKGEERPGRFSFVMGSNWLLTISTAASPGFTHLFREQDKGETDIGSLTSAQLLAALLDWLLDAFFGEVSHIERRVDALDEDILKRSAPSAILHQMVAVRRTISELRRVLAEQRSVFYALARPDICSGLDADVQASFERLGERLERAIDEVERTRDVLVGSFDLFATLSAQTTNDLVSTLTFATVVLGAASAIAGLFGMNFDLPLYRTGTAGFMATVGILTLLSGVSLWIARRRGWI